MPAAAARRRPWPSPPELLAQGFVPTGRTAPEPFLAVLMLVALPAAWLRWGPRLVDEWSRWHEAAGIVPLALLAVPATGHVLRRLTDMGLRGAWAWLLLVPWLRWVLLAALVLAPSSQRRRNPDGALRAFGLGLAGLAALGLLGSLLWTAAPVLAHGMRPALRPGDLVLLRRAPLPLAPGDVIAFRGADGPGWGRLVARGPARVAVEDGVPVIDGRPARRSDAGLLSEPFRPEGPRRALPVCGNGAVGLGAECRTRLWRETLPDGASFLALDAGQRPLDRMEPVEVPPGHLFVLGDDRDAARDSRLAPGVGGAGLVPEEAVIGRASLVLVSAAGRRPWDPRYWRPSRLFEPVR